MNTFLAFLSKLESHNPKLIEAISQGFSACFESNELEPVAFPSPPSAHALAVVGVAGVAEPAAILASGGGRLLLNKVKSANVTLAVAELKEGI